MVKKILSGAQTGADQATLDVEINLGVLHNGKDQERLTI